MMLSLTIFAILLAGVYSAYKHFSGLDPLKLDPQAVFREVVHARTPQQLLAALSTIKLPQNSSSKTQVLGQTAPIPNPDPAKTTQPAFSFLLFADSHNDNDNLQKAISQAKNDHPDLKFIIGVGDYTNVGTVAELTAAKTVLDGSGLRYFLIAGDHDLWDARNRDLKPSANFQQVFGPLYQSFVYNNFKFLLLDNSDDYTGISEDQHNWINAELSQSRLKDLKGILAFISSPLYHPSSDHYMGKVDKKLQAQAQSLIYQLKGAEVKKVFAGDIHYFSEYEEPVTKLSMMTVGAVVTDRNPQAPRYAIITVFDDGEIKVDDVAIK